MIRKMMFCLLATMFVAVPAFAHVHFGVLGAIGGKACQYGRILVHVEVPSNDCGAGQRFSSYGSDGLVAYYRSTNPRTHMQETNPAWNEVRVNGEGNALLIFDPQGRGIKTITFTWPDNRQPEIIPYPSLTTDREFEGHGVYRHMLHARFRPEIVTVTVEFVNADGSFGGKDDYQYTFMGW